MSKRRVIGISHSDDGAAPRVVVKGAGEAAAAVLERARSQTDTPIVRDPALVDQLYRVPIDTAIGKDLFPVMAALLIHVLSVDSRLVAKKLRGAPG
jgi:type III secretion system FlhB-like substrate exporter